MTDLEVRPAREEDREAVLAFCEHTWDWGDYIENVWDRWLHDPDGTLFVATVDEKPVGISHIRMLTRYDAWLEGLRIDPDYRQQGIARLLNRALVDEARRRDASYIRLTIDATNTRSIQITEQGGMRRIGSFANYRATAELTTASEKRPLSEQIQRATLDDLDEMIGYLNRSNIFPLFGGLYYSGFAGYPITGEMLREKIEQQQVYLLLRWDRLDGLAIGETRLERGEERLSVGYIDGTAIEAISIIAYDLCRILPEMGLEKVRIYAPDMVMVQDALTGIGYEWDNTVFHTYESEVV